MPASRPHRRLSLAWLVAMVVAAVAAAFNVGKLPPDPHTRYLVAESIVRDGDLTIEPSLLSVENDAGETYSVFFPGQTILFLPVATGAELARRAVGGRPETWTVAGSMAASLLLMCPIAGLAVLGHVRLLEHLGLRTKVAAASGLMLGLGTQLIVWATAGSEELVLAAIASWSVLGALRGRDALGRADAATAAAHLGPAGLLLALALAHRATALPLVIGWLMLVLPAVRPLGVAGTTRLAARVLPWLVTAILLVALVPLYDWLRFGDPLDTGYARYYEPFGGLWATPLWAGLGGHLVSPGKSVFLYSPWLLLALPAAASVRVRRRLGPLGPMLLVVTVLHLLIYARTTFWAGGLGFGVRFHVSLMPLWLVPIALWTAGDRDRVEPGPRRGTLGRAAIAGVAAVSIGMQGLGLALNTGYENLADPTAYDPVDGRWPRAAAWEPARSPILIRAAAVGRKLAGEDILPEGEPESKRIQAAWNVMPTRAAAMMPDRRGVVLATWVLFGALLALAGAMGGWLAWRWHREA